MLGWKIVVHSVRMVFRNLKEALQIGLVPNVLAALFSTFVLQAAAPSLIAVEGTELAPSPEGLFVGLGVGLVSFIVTIWICVAWHRFVLLEEYPTGWIPSFRADRFFDYIGYSFLLIAICLVAAVCFSVPLVVIGAVLSAIPFFGVIAQVVPLFVLVLVYLVFLRLGAVLPAAAIGTPFGLKAAKDATAGTNGILIVTAAFMLFAQLAVAVLLIMATQFLPIIGIASQTIIGLILSLVNVSVLTTVYGIYVEKRQLA